ncbi:M24 family metallopeptidase [Conexibacter stalactiti]|uniref:M24 family metallopeptidase n=1 Tax=Conexibacter stalactiti TaxID=1940611 RepID=A0ABU4HQ51_9ACTN|nr:M24 family metallopeptidase [Conexibacter stalactiti]MDW5595411.1 M24 family metallopeptidase [Conexibacter stalactiti]MEC5036053.1 M24 family metallopeptidase [Conexibacter stalactiti]
MTEAKRAALRALLERHGLDALVLSDAANVGWWLDGVRTHVAQLADGGEAIVVVRRDGEELRTSESEAPRLREEAFAHAPHITVLGWWESLMPSFDAEERVGSDRPDAVAAAQPAHGAVADLSADLATLRAPLSDAEQDRLRALGGDAATALTAALERARDDETEHALAGRTTGLLLERAIEPLCLLVASGERLPRFRHPIPTAAPLGERALVVVCGRRDGLVVSLSRIRAFARPAPRQQDAYRALLEVEAALLAGTRAGARLGDVAQAGRDAYGANGLPADEWRRHHQGGPCGYTLRDKLATPADDDVIAAGQAFAWNPTGGGWKVEDTVVARTAASPEVMTADPAWPTVEVGGLERPDVLVV